MRRADPLDGQDPVGALVQIVRAGDGQEGRLSKAQKRFGKLVTELAALRVSLSQWQDCAPMLARRVALELEPLFARYRAARVQMIMLLQRAIDGGELAKRQQAKAVEIMCWYLAEILEAGADANLIALYDQYAAVDYAQKQTNELTVAHQSAALGAEHDKNEHRTGLGSSAQHHRTADVADWEADGEFDFAQRAAAYRRAAKAQAQVALGQQLAQAANRSVREIYRKLASELHPDRELDPAQRVRKTALMQRANLAYASRDLPTLLGLQLLQEQLDGSALAFLPRERLLQYNHLLAEQCQQLHDELAVLTAPFAQAGSGAALALTREHAERAIEREGRLLKRALKACEADVVYFRNMRNIKRFLDDYRLGELHA